MRRLNFLTLTLMTMTTMMLVACGQKPAIQGAKPDTVAETSAASLSVATAEETTDMVSNVAETLEADMDLVSEDVQDTAFTPDDVNASPDETFGEAVDSPGETSENQDEVTWASPVPAITITPLELPSPPVLADKGTAEDPEAIALRINEDAGLPDAGQYFLYDNRWFYIGEHGETQVVKALRTPEDGKLDAFMKSYSYPNYDLEFYYGNPDNRSYMDPEPILIRGYIEGTFYSYYFTKGELVRREAGYDEGSNNTKTNSFLKSLYDFAWHEMYFEPDEIEATAPTKWAGKDGTYETMNFTVTGGKSAIKFVNDKVYLEGTVRYTSYEPLEEYPDDYTLIMDLDTQLDDPDQLTDGQQGDTALSWMRRLHDDDGDLNVNGRYEVRITGDHIDAVHGLYWWD